MKKILVLLILPLFMACSAEEAPIQEETAENEEKVIITNYYLVLRAECVGGAEISSFQVVEETYLNVVNSTNVGDCDTFFSITDINGNVHEGYLDGEYTTTY